MSGIAKIRRDRRTLFSNGGWAYDAYRDMKKLDAYARIVIADFAGPGIVNHIHITQQWVHPEIPGKSVEERKAISARGIILEVYYNDHPEPAVRVPMGDFFADGCGGAAEHFSSLYVEKAPEAYNAFIPMPFAQAIRIELVNETTYDFMNYSYVEGETLPVWEEDLGYFHATWDRFTFQLTPDTDLSFLRIEGSGHLLGRSWSVCTDEPEFAGFRFVMEGNNEFWVDGAARPVADYLGTEDAFGFSWGFRHPFSGLRNGMNAVHAGKEDGLSMVSMYRFSDANPLRFERSLELRLDWTSEYWFDEALVRALADFRRLAAQDRLWVDYATTYYWYQADVGHAHAEMLPLDERLQRILHPNSK